MPITYQMVPIEGFIRETWTGDVEIRHLREHWKSMLADSCCVDTAKTLVDLRHATLVFSELELQAAIQEVGLPLLHHRAWISAIVVRCSSQLRMASRYQGLAAMFSRDTIFSRMLRTECSSAFDSPLQARDAESSAAQSWRSLAYHESQPCGG